MIKNQISIFVENQTGRLTSVTGLLADNNINLEALNIAETSDYGILRVIVDDDKKAENILKENSFICSITPVIEAGVPNVPGGLNKLLQKLSDADIGIEYMYSFFSGDNNEAKMIIKVNDNEKAEKVL